MGSGKKILRRREKIEKEEGENGIKNGIYGYYEIETGLGTASTEQDNDPEAVHCPVHSGSYQTGQDSQRHYQAGKRYMI